jgi:hypothetical protein
MVGMAGMDPRKWLEEKDPFKRSVMQTIAQRRRDVAEDERQDLAQRIITVLSENIK